MSSAPFTCKACDTVVSDNVGRCPTCGAELGQLPALRPRTLSFAPRNTARRASSPSRIAILALSALLPGVVIWWSATRSDGAPHAPPSSTPPPTAATEPTPVPELTRLTPPAQISTALGGAKREALRWHPAAQLVSIRTAPLAANGAGPPAEAHFTFGTPKGNVGPGSPISPAGLSVTFADGKFTSSALRLLPKQKSVAEPNCPLDAALRHARASGLSEDSTVARYQHADQHQRAVWTFAPNANAEADRTLDGNSCAVLTRH